MPVPVPSDVHVSLVVGLSEVPQQTPLTVTAAPPSDVTFPPLEAAADVMEDAAVVVTPGVVAPVANVRSHRTG